MKTMVKRSAVHSVGDALSIFLTKVFFFFPWRWWLKVGSSLERFIQDDAEKHYEADPMEEKIHDLKDEMSLIKDRMKIMMQSIEHQNQLLRSTLVTSRSSISEDKDTTTFWCAGHIVCGGTYDNSATVGEVK